MEELKEGWRKVKLGDVIDFNPKETLKKNTISKYVEMAQLQCFARNIIGYSFREYKGGTKFRNGDTLLARITPCLENGKTAFVDILEEDEVGFGSTEYIVLRKKEGYTDENYIFYLAISDLFRQIAIKSMTGTSGRQRVQTEVLKNSEIVIPEVNIQKKIASILSLLDEKIELNRKINQNLEEIAQTLFKRWFIDFEFPNEEGKSYKSNGGKMIESELGEIPEGWRSFSLKDIVKQIKPGTNFQPKRLDKGIPFLNIKNIVNSEIDLNDVKYISEVDYEKVHKTWKPQEKDILISRIGTLGLVTILKKNKLPIAVHYNFLVIKAKKISSYFLYFLLKSQEFQKKYDSIKKQSVQEYVTVEDVEEIKVVLPENLEILYEKYFISFYKEIIKNQDEIYKLKELRDYLLPRLMSGEISV